MNALILDDEPMPAKHLEELIKQSCFEIKSTVVINSPNEALELLKTNEFNVLFLDVEMPEMSGVEFLKCAKISRNTAVIFTTAYSEYAVDAFKLNAIHYIMKPIEEVELIKAVRKVMLRLGEPETKTSKLSVFDGEEYSIIDFNEIIRLEADGSYTHIVLDSKVILASKRMGTFIDKLPKSEFVRCHNSHVINLKKVKKFGKNKSNYLVMVNAEVIPISASKKMEVEKALGL